MAHRTMLYVPAADPAKLGKIDKLRDLATIILDLEDSVPPDRKQHAREAAAEILTRSDTNGGLWVRINSDKDDLREDLQSIVRPALSGIIVAKAEDPETIRSVDSTVSSLEAERGMPEGRVALAPTIESVAGLTGISQIARSSRRIHWLGFGASDFCSDLGIEWSRETPPNPTLTHARVLIVIASRDAGLSRPHDGAFVYFDDRSALRAAAEEARAIGFGSKHAIHPDQVDVLDEVFGVSERDVEHARLVLESFESAKSRGRGNAELDGELIDLSVAERAARLLGESE